MLSFENTEIAFKSKSNKDLNRAYFLYKVIASNALVFMGSKLSLLALKIHFPINWAVKPTVYSHFVGGETIDECHDTVRVFEKYNVKAILDYSVEGKESLEDINNAMTETLKTIHNAAKDSNVPFAVFKPTAFTKEIVLEKVSAGMDLTEEEKEEADNFRKRVGTLCKTAYENDVPILIDAEDSFFQNFIDEVVDDNMEKYNKKGAIVFNTYRCTDGTVLKFWKRLIIKRLKKTITSGPNLYVVLIWKKRGPAQKKKVTKTQSSLIRTPPTEIIMQP